VAFGPLPVYSLDVCHSNPINDPMFVDCLDRHLAVCSENELPAVTRRDPGFWHSISIMEPRRPLASTERLRDVLSLRFDDVENREAEEAGVTGPMANHIKDAFSFADDHWGEPLLIQCWAGLSRITALALGMLSRGLFLDGDECFTEQAVELILQIRPEANPNALVLMLALETFLPTDHADAKTREMVNHSMILNNGFKRW